ncbi:MAG: hypothetical protein JO029_02570 [Candidatus Eremiobacteraeota bacterium]|nr:hypothetical protein [Candidatus Eremiobacteraeota bacterium]MBV8283851.1 hypothetical protein [Candidatus Eremiobacteraeota bacterium]MBV8333675.1 hypothetical protein [Candidatus Eremiobacteraeota bacterium]MBV8433144.1 hypothetical protein [Candidatus Eremiobacteraeota bacterium]
MDISFAFGSFVVLLGAWTIAARRRSGLHPLPARTAAGEPGFLRRLAS